MCNLNGVLDTVCILTTMVCVLREGYLRWHLILASFTNTEIRLDKLTNHRRPFLEESVHWVINLHITGFITRGTCQLY